MIGSTIMPKPGLPANSTLAMGRPEARLFLEPQKTAAISSPKEKPKRRASQRVRTSTPTSKSRHSKIAQITICQGSSRHSPSRSEEHTSELQSRPHLVCRLLLEKKKQPSDLRHDL